MLLDGCAAFLPFPPMPVVSVSKQAIEASWAIDNAVSQPLLQAEGPFGLQR